LVEAGNRLEVAKQSLKDGLWSFCVRQSQECVELSLKACLRLAGVEYPKEHDVSLVLLDSGGRFPGWFQGEIPVLADYSKTLVKMRGPSMYGDEMRGIPAEKLFVEKDAAYALEGADRALSAAKRLLDQTRGLQGRPGRSADS